MRFVNAAHIKKYLKDHGKRTSRSALLAISGHIETLLARGARNTPRVTVQDDDIFPGSK